MKTFKQIREFKFKATNPTKDVSGYPEAKGIVDKIIKFRDIEGAGVGVGTTMLSKGKIEKNPNSCLLYTSPSPRDATLSRMPSSA